VAKSFGAQVETLNGDGSGSLTDKAVTAPQQFDTVTRREDDLAALMYSSGTTGRSKGAMLTETNLLSNARTLAQGELGAIEVGGPNVFKGYWQMPDKTAAELREDGFFITGDLGVIDTDGYVSIVGRSKDLIISGGYNIYPKEAELVLDEQEGVLESAVIGVPHRDFGETVVGVLVPKNGKTLDTDGIMEVIKAPLARFKHPRRLVVVDSLSRNTMGKVQKNVLRDQYKGLFL
jgi:malonyl-CoA/methylmalonyl-CoA synthetase